MPVQSLHSRLNESQRNKHRGEHVSSDEWYTPPELIRALGEFDLDPACGPLCKNKTAKRRFQSRGAERQWNGRVWCNPPFSDVVPFVDKMIEHGNGIMLVFGRTDAKWFQRAIAAAGGFFMFAGRTEFIRPLDLGRSRCPLGCVLIPFGKSNVNAIKKANLKGTFARV